MLNNTLSKCVCILDTFTHHCVTLVLEFIIQVPPPPSAGAALISALKLLEGARLSENNNTENQTYHWIAEVLESKAKLFFILCPVEMVALLCKMNFHLPVKALNAALAMASGLGDPKYNSSVTELLSDMLR